MTKPFNLADAKAGHPITTLGGLPTRLLSTDVVGGPLPVQQAGTLYFADEQGSVRPVSGAPFVRSNLVMAPLGQVDGRDVYPGDLLLHRGTYAETPVPHGVPFNEPDWAWPQTYPESQMPEWGLGPAASVKEVADAAIRHGILHGYLYDAKEINPLFNRLYPRLEHDGSLTFEQQVDRATGLIEAFRGILKDIARLVDMEQGLKLDELPGYVEKLVTERDELLKMNGSQAGEITRRREEAAARDKVLGGIHKLVSAESRWTPESVIKGVQRTVDLHKEQAVRLKRNWDIAHYFYRLGNTEMDHAGVISDERILAELKQVPR